MKTSQPIILYFFISLLLVARAGKVFSQSQHNIDSFLNEIKKYDANKMEGGSNAPALSDSTKANLLYALCVEYSSIDFDAMRDYARQLLSLSQKIGYKKGEGNAYTGLGAYYIFKGENDTALEYQKKVRRIGVEIGDKNSIANSYNNTGAIYQNMGNYSEALKNYINALKVREDMGSKKGAAAAYNNIGNIYLSMRKFDDALENELKSLKLSKEIGDMAGIAKAFNDIGNNYYEREKYDEALKNYNEALRIHLEIGSLINLAALYVNIGDVWKAKQNYDEALKNYVEAIKTSEEIGDEIVLTSAYLQAGAVYETLGDLPKALKYETLGLEYAKNTGQKDKIKNAYRIIAMVHAKNKNYKEAFENEQLYLLTYEEIFNKENEKNITKLQMQYEFEKKEVEAKAKHDKEVALAQKETEYQKSIRNYIFMGMAVVVLFLIMLLIQRNKIAQERRQKALEQERSRISRDLHDDLGSGLTGILMMSDQIQATDNKELIGSSVEKIKHSSRYMVDQMGEIIWAMNAKNDTLENLVSYIRTYALDYFENVDTKLHFTLPETIPDTELSGIMRRNIFLVVKESLNNTAKHSNAADVTMQFELNGSNVIILIADNGKGFEMATTRRFGNGLKNMESRMTEINGTFRIESNRGGGTKTFISIPLSS